MVGSFIVIRFDILIRRNKVEIMDRIEMTFGVFEALGGPLVVIESNAGADDVQDSATVVSESALNERRQLFAVAGKASGDVSRAQSDRQLGHIDGRNVIHFSTFHD